MSKYHQRFGKIKQKPASVSISQETHARLVALAISTNQTLGFWANFGIDAFINSCGPDIQKRYRDLREKQEKESFDFQHDYRMTVPDNAIKEAVNLPPRAALAIVPKKTA